MSCGEQLDTDWERSIYGEEISGLKNRKGGKKAIVAIARMLIIRVRRILLDNEPYLLKAA